MADKKSTPKKPAKDKRLSPASRFSRPDLVVFAALFAAVGGIIIWRSLAAPTPPAIYLSPAAQTLPANTNFSVQVRETSGSTSVNAVQANVTYDPTLVDFVSTDDTGAAYTVDAQCPKGAGNCTASNGVIDIARGTSGGTAVTGDQLVTTINFKTKAATGVTNMAFTTGTAMVNSSSNQYVTGLTTTGGSYTVDATAPTVSVTAPASGATLASGSTNTISVTASDNQSVSSVDIYVDGSKITTLTSSPYTYSWNTTGLALGSHTLQAKATDPSGNVGSSAVNTVNIADQTAPSVSVTAPTGGSAVKGTVNITATATDNSGGTGISKVEFYVDGALKSTDTSSPFTYAWDSTTATNASHSLTAKAYDSATPVNSATSAAVSVTVDNSPPSTPGSFRLTAATTTTANLAWNAATDNAAVTGYKLSRNGSVIATLSSSTLTYNDTALTGCVTYSYSLAATDAAGNLSATPATLSVTTRAAKTGDLNCDGKVDLLDLSTMITYYNTTNPIADIDNSGKVDLLDLSALITNYGT